jgi:RHS repeat-associated protein
VVNAYAYTPDGMILGENEAFAQPFKYVGQLGVMAEPNGLYYMRARYYNPAVGRFISEDPLGFGGGDVNLYVYAGNNPVVGVDPWGLSWRSVALGSTSAVLSTASLATMYYPAVSAPLKAAGTFVGVISVANAVYEHHTRAISSTELAVTVGTEAANFIGGFAAQPVEAFINGITRGIGVATTSIDAVRMMAPAPQPSTAYASTPSTYGGKNN